MLRSLKIQNYALIDHLEINFCDGLNTITGETGAGKSILLGALTLILGQRADSSVLKDKTKSCVVEAEFDITGYHLEDFFNINDLDFEQAITIRRIINDSGKSRAYINEIPANLAVLKNLGDSLLDIHSQHQNLLLGSSLFQMKVLDAFAGTKEELDSYSTVFKNYQTIKNELQQLADDAQNAGKDLEYLKHQHNELNASKLKADELAELEQLQLQLTHAGEIKTALQHCSQTISNDTTSILANIKEIQNGLKHIAPHYPQAADLDNRLESCRIELKDIASESENHFTHIDVDENELERISARIDMLYSLLQKHHVETVGELIALRDDFAKRISMVETLDFDLETRRKKLETARAELQQKAAKISNKRGLAIPKLETNITQLLEQLGIKFASFKVDIQHLAEFQPQGSDRITFYFSANKQIEACELAKVASGGELSRLMLSLKSLLAESTGLATIIFDEIDTGVSGDIADKMGSIIASMSKKMQVINITHLPQIAAKGQTHFLVYKDNSTAQTITRISLLSPEERVMAIAKMLSGEKITDAAISNAKELLK